MKKNRVRCSDKDFIEAVYNSQTYNEISEKTGQKLASTIARYNRTKTKMEEQGVILPQIKKQKIKKQIKNLSIMKTIANQLGLN